MRREDTDAAKPQQSVVQRDSHETRGVRQSKSEGKGSIVTAHWDLFCVCVCVLSWIQVFATLWTVACQTPLSMGFSRQEYCSRLPFPPPGDLPYPGMETLSPVSPAMQVIFFFFFFFFYH